MSVSKLNVFRSNGKKVSFNSSSRNKIRSAASKSSANQKMRLSGSVSGSRRSKSDVKMDTSTTDSQSSSEHLGEEEIEHSQVHSKEDPPEIPLKDEISTETSAKDSRKQRRNDFASRLEYLARPKKDFLDEMQFERQEGTLPERALPAWKILPLPTKLPVARYPHKITMTKLASDLYLPPPGKDMDLFDEHNRRPPVHSYHSMHDPQLKGLYSNKKLRKHLEKSGYISQSGKVVSSLGDINTYRQYQRRILAANIQQLYRDEYEEERKQREKELKEKTRAEEEKCKDKRSQALLRSYIKNTVASIKEGSMADQTAKDLKVLNREIRLYKEWREKADAKRERYERLYLQHISQKYDRESKKRLAELELTKRDLERIHNICIRQEEEKLKRKAKLEEFWNRKGVHQLDWLERGYDLEEKWRKDREDRINARKKNVREPPSSGKKDERKSESRLTDEEQEETLDEALMDDEGALTLEDLLLKEQHDDYEGDGDVSDDSTYLTSAEFLVQNVATSDEERGDSRLSYAKTVKAPSLDIDSEDNMEDVGLYKKPAVRSVSEILAIHRKFLSQNKDILELLELEQKLASKSKELPSSSKAHRREKKDENRFKGKEIRILPEDMDPSIPLEAYQKIEEYVNRLNDASEPLENIHAYMSFKKGDSKMLSRLPNDMTIFISSEEEARVKIADEFENGPEQFNTDTNSKSVVKEVSAKGSDESLVEDDNKSQKPEDSYKKQNSDGRDVSKSIENDKADTSEDDNIHRRSTPSDKGINDNETHRPAYEDNSSDKKDDTSKSHENNTDHTSQENPTQSNLIENNSNIDGATHADNQQINNKIDTEEGKNNQLHENESEATSPSKSDKTSKEELVNSNSTKKGSMNVVWESPSIEDLTDEVAGIPPNIEEQYMNTKKNVQDTVEKDDEKELTTASDIDKRSTDKNNTISKPPRSLHEEVAPKSTPTKSSTFATDDEPVAMTLEDDLKSSEYGRSTVNPVSESPSIEDLTKKHADSLDAPENLTSDAFSFPSDGIKPEESGLDHQSPVDTMEVSDENDSSIRTEKENDQYTEKM